MEKGVTCSDLDDFPVELDSAVGANFDGTPVVCGGNLGSYTPSEKCYRLTFGEWEEITSMLEKRGYAAGVVYNKNLHVFGGRSDSGIVLKTSETINVDGGISDGPDLPTAVYSHAMTSINDTVSLLSGGSTNANFYSAKTWYYHHDTESFTSGPDLLEARRLHGSATNVDKETKAKITVVTGGWNGNYMDSTELLINGQWETGTIFYRNILFYLLYFFFILGPPLPKALEKFAMLEIHGDIFVIGGRDSSHNEQSLIYQLGCSSGLCSWSTLNQQLKVARNYLVAIHLPDYACR